VNVVHSCCYKAKQPNLKLKTQPKQLLCYLLLDIALAPIEPISSFSSALMPRERNTKYFNEKTKGNQETDKIQH
jgi:hypothetical protein